ncbi:DegT/DnrJ/EryC1/StrS family aminotransferase [Nafulsella turpanensis]|uniref:DegT/DnrJ/EryC1/StrS family aminotransferase n=1 Tax=Nafulsella turpanensis TaxID=1265690 RepID=UPI000344E550|nr:DegT/DnrJ/EryC1/StrS family aminotransferase [Nafulsella turpanensis]
MIPVTKPFLPPKEVFENYINGIWKRNWLTNHGPLVNELELKLKDYLELDHLLYLNNGTIALQIAIKALNLKGEVITTPFSYVATTSSIVWEGCVPVFVDIDSKTLNIDPEKIEAAVTENTSAILATHVYGNPCDVEKIEKIASKHNLKVIYDAAHCFGTQYKGESVFGFGDISTTSFHATKLFHTIEGGAVITKDPGLLKKMSYLRNFGHEGTESFADLGINGKNSEFHAAMGLSNLPFIKNIIQKREELSNYYHLKLEKLNIERPIIQSYTQYNYAYYPIIFPSEEQLLKSKAELEKYQIFSRRYFYPSLETLPYVKEYDVPIAGAVSKRALCLPLYYDLSYEEIDMIARILLRVQKYQ